MSAVAEIKNPHELREAGVKALTDALGDANAHNFLEQWRGIPGRDLTKWLSERPSRSPDEVIADAERMQGEYEKMFDERGIPSV